MVLKKEGKQLIIRLSVYLIPITILVLGSLLHYIRGAYGFFPIESSLQSVGADDAFISYRYGWNLAQHGILSWNESGFRRTEGFTNPLWVLVSAFWSLIGNKDLIYPMMVITSLVLSIFLLAILIRYVFLKNDRSTQSIFGIVLAVAIPAMWLHTTSGLESAVFGIGLALLAYLVIYFDPDKPQKILIVSLAILQGLLRSDGFVYLLIILFAGLFTGKKSWKPLLLGLFIGIVVLLSWRYISFGTFLPNTAVAKLNFGLLDRIPTGFTFLRITLLNSGLIIFLLIGMAGLWLESRRIGLAGLFITIAWIGYYLYFGGDGYFERHLIGLYLLLGAFSGPLWLTARLVTRAIFIIVILLIGFVSIRSFGNRFDYFSDKPDDPWISLGKALELDREKYGVVVIHAAGKLPFFGGGDMVDVLGINDSYLATFSQEKFFPGHSAGDVDAALVVAKNHPIGIYSRFSYLDPEVIFDAQQVALWVDNNLNHGKVMGIPTEEQWGQALQSGSIKIWSIITKPTIVERE